MCSRTPPKSTRQSFSLMNELAEFEDMEVVEIFDNFRLNQLVLLVKTFNSWNAAAPDPAPRARPYVKTLTINVEPVG